MKNVNVLTKINFSKIVDADYKIPFYKNLTQKIIEYLESNGASSFSEIVAYVGGGERRVARLLDQMVNLKILRFKSPKFSLFDSKIEYKIKMSDIRCASCNSMLVDINKKIKPLIKFMEKVLLKRPKSTFVFDQRPVNIDTVARRVAYMILRGDMQNKKIAVIGDDDFTGLALAWTGMAKEVVVFEIDERILNFSDMISKQYKLNIKLRKQNLLDKAPTNYLNYFDTFITDPTPTVKPLTLFTLRGLEMLDKVENKTGYISLYPSHMAMNIDFQKVLNKMNILITDLIPFLNQYEIIKEALEESDIKLLKEYDPAEESISFYENLMRIQTTKNTKLFSHKFLPIDLLGKATKQILKTPEIDPVLREKNMPAFIKSYAKNLKVMVKHKH